MKNSKTNKDKISQTIIISLRDFFHKGKIVDIRLCDVSILITEVVISDNYRECKCYFRILNTDLPAQEIENILNQSAYKIQSFVNTSLSTRITPKLYFRYDKRLDKINELEDIFDKIKKNKI